ncbi:MAG: hypothetical protein K5641_07725, partial [Lachnospiraceae bacterium]|nr:hypothetical protein [Lachnospiraceae bacterium]
MRKISKHLLGLFLCALFCSCALVMPVNAGNSYGIDADAPCEGQEDVIEYSGKEETYEVKVTGIYDVTACGGQGGTGLGYSSNKDMSTVSPDTAGSYGSKTQSRIFLKEGTKLTVHVGSVGGTGHLGHHYGESVTGGSGGWSDGERGGSIHNFDSDNKNKDCSIATGGGGGSSYLLYEGKKILSAAGGGSATMTLKRHELRTQYGASGGGSSLIENAGDLTWMTDDVKVMESGKNKGNGKIIFKLVRPRIGMELHQDHDDWTKDEVTVRAEITSTGEGVPDDCYFWEYEPKEDADDAETEGAPLGEWTGEDSITVHANGTVTCKVRDVNENEEEAVLKVTNIDRKGPRISAEFEPDDWTMDPVTLTIKASDEDGCGLADEGYLWSDDTEILPDDEGDYELQWNSVTSKIYEENASVTVAVRDKLGNRTEKTIRITNIDRTAPTV